MGSQNLPPGRTLTDADVEAIAAKLKSTVVVKQPVTQIASSVVEKQLVATNALLSKTYGPVGRIGSRGDTSAVHPPARPKRLVMRREGTRAANPNPIKITEPRVTAQVRSQVKPATLSRIPLNAVAKT